MAVASTRLKRGRKMLKRRRGKSSVKLLSGEVVCFCLRVIGLNMYF